MAVYTILDRPELEDLLSSYSIGQLVSFEGIATGVENTNYRVRTSEGQFILTLYEKRVATADLPFFLDLKQLLAGLGLPVPRPVTDRAGRILQKIQNRDAALVTFLPGQEISPVTPGACAQVGKILARLHNATRDLLMQRRNALSVGSWPALLAECPAAMDVDFPGLLAELASECMDLSNHWPTSLPRGIIHADLFPDNILFDGDQIGGIIDFYFACTDILTYDLAICIAAWCFDAENRLRSDCMQAMLSGYGEIRPLEDCEISALPILLRGATLRFTLTRLVDFYSKDAVNGSKKDPNQFLERQRFFRQSSGELEL